LEELKGKQHTFTLSFAHNDFWHKHIYHDPQRGSITGIIDWGDICITDPAWDFYGVWAYGERFVDSILSHYEHDDPDLKYRSKDYYRLKTAGAICIGYRNGLYGRQLLSNNHHL
jgi:hypothetical protein